jgi:hypothetical protein
LDKSRSKSGRIARLLEIGEAPGAIETALLGFFVRMKAAGLVRLAPETGEVMPLQARGYCKGQATIDLKFKGQIY